MKNFLQNHKIDICIFLLALAARMLLFAVNFHAADGNLINTIHGDDGYYEISRNLAAGHGFTGEDTPPYTPNNLRTPLYIFIIAGILLVSKSYWLVIFIQMIIGSFIPVLSRHVAIRITLNSRIGFFVGIFTCFEPYLVLFSSIFYTETLFIFLFLLFILAFLEYLREGSMRLLFWSSLLLGLTTLTKTTVQYLPIFLIPIIIWNFRKQIVALIIIKHVTIFIVLFLAVLSPWLFRNYQEFGAVGMSAQPAFNIYVYLAPSLLSIENGTSVSSEQAKFATVEESGGRVINLANSGEYTRKAFSVVKNHPKALMISVGITFVTFFSHDGMLTVLQHAGLTPSVLMQKSALGMIFSSPLKLLSVIGTYIASPFVSILIMRFVWIIITILFFVGYWIFVRKNGFNFISVIILAIVAYFVVTSVVGGLGVSARYRMPIVPIILTFACVGFITIKNDILAKLRDRNKTGTLVESS